MLKRLSSTSVPGLSVWQIDIRIDGHRGKRIQKRFEATAKDAATIYADYANAQSRASLGLNYSLPTDKMLLSSAAAEYEKHLLALGYDSTYICDTVRAMSALQAITKDIPVSLISRQHLIQWQLQRVQKGKARTANKQRAELSAFMQWCLDNSWCDSNPVLLVPKVKEVQPPIKDVQWDVFCKFADACWEYRPAVALAVEIAAETGARIGEVLAAKTADVDIRRQVLTKVVKGGRRIIIRAGPWTLKAAAAGHELLCPGEDGKVLKYQDLRLAFKKVCKEIGVPRFTPHALRHMRAAVDLEAGRSVSAVQAQLGHTSVATTERYLRAANALKQPEVSTPQRVPFTQTSPTEFTHSSPRSGSGDHSGSLATTSTAVEDCSVKLDSGSTCDRKS